MQSIVVDAGPLISLFRRRDKYHARVKAAVSTSKAKLVSTIPVITEACHFLNSNGKLALLNPERIAMPDIDIDFADATLIWLASLLNTAGIMTIDRGDFEVYRLANGKPFTLLLA